MSLWPHQSRALAELDACIAPGAAICLAAATGMGKTRMMVELLKRDVKAALYTNRKMLLEQTASVLESHGIRFGVRAAGHITDMTKPIQLCSVQTTDARSLKGRKWKLPDAELVLIDEAHVNKEGVMQAIIDQHHAQGAALVGVTATPLNIGHIYNRLILAGQPSEGRECGALVPAHTFAPDEPDCSKIKRTATGEYTAGDVRKLIMTHSIVGRVIEHYLKLNPAQAPTLLFAPGVKESLWFAEQLCYPERREGAARNLPAIPAAHIDGEQIWIKGEVGESDKYSREQLIERWRSGEIKVVCNRFVLREGIDAPFIRHMIFATIFGALTSFIQSGGRGLRADHNSETVTRYGPKSHVIVQDHGGNWHRHGSLNSDREWALEGESADDRMRSEIRERRMREKKDIEPILCPKCHAVRSSGPVCKNCGFTHTTRSRMVVQHDGTLKEQLGDIYKPERVYRKPDVATLWRSYYFRAKNSRDGMTFNQARALFAKENYWAWPPRDLPLTPMQDADWYQLVRDVPATRLRGAEDIARRAAILQ